MFVPKTGLIVPNKTKAMPVLATSTSRSLTKKSKNNPPTRKSSIANRKFLARTQPRGLKIPLTPLPSQGSFRKTFPTWPPSNQHREF
jgi:hypothetical protein